MKAASASKAGLSERVIMTMLLTLGIGPLVGTAMIFLAAGLGLLPETLADVAADVSIPLALLLGYAVGGLQALICGGVFAAVGSRTGKLPIWLPIAIALPLALAFKVAIFGKLADGFILSILVHIVPALVTWWLVRRYWQKADA